MLANDYTLTLYIENNDILKLCSPERKLELEQRHKEYFQLTKEIKELQTLKDQLKKEIHQKRTYLN